MSSSIRLVVASIIALVAIQTTPLAAQDASTSDTAATQRSIIGQISARRIDNLRPEQDTLFVDDMVFKIDRRAKGAAAFRIARWPNGVVAYEFADNVDKIVQKKVKAAFKEWSDAAPVRFVKRKKEKNYILITNDNSDGAWSYVGMSGGSQKLNLPTEAPYATALHEIAHALGFRHEQGRSDRDRYIQVLKNNIIDAAEGNFDIQPGVNCTPYDFASVMHYPATGFSVNGQPTIRVRPQYAHYANVIGQRNGLTEMDKLAMRKLYTDKSCDPSLSSTTAAIPTTPVGNVPAPSRYQPNLEPSTWGSVAGLHAGAFVHSSQLDFEGGNERWTGEGYSFRGAMGLGNFLVLHGEIQYSMLSFEDATETTTWDFNDQEVGARAYLLGKGSFFRPYAQGAYSFRKILISEERGVRGNAIVYGGGVEVFVLPGFALEVNATFGKGKYTTAFNENGEATFEELGIEPISGIHRRISAGLSYHIR